MSWEEVTALKRELERLQLDHTLEKRDLEQRIEQAARDVHETRREVSDLREAHERCGQRVDALEATMPSSTAELLVLASTRAAGLLALVASRDDLATIRTLEAAASTLPSRTIYTNGDPYLTRWYVWPEGPRTVEDEDLDQHAGDPANDLPFAVFLHKFHRGDRDRDQHNHPWDFSVAIVLAGGYREERGTGIKTYMPGMINVIRDDDFHRVELLDPEAGSWSLFIAGRRTPGGWGFKDATTGRFIPNREYLASRENR